jgi:hypothetical protein
MMGYRRVDTLGDAMRYGAVIEVRCLRCQRVRYITPSCLHRPSKADRLRIRPNVDIVRIGRIMVCRGGDGAGIGCGHKGAATRPVMPDFLPPTPAGVDKVRWLNADDRERKRLVRAARG